MGTWLWTCCSEIKLYQLVWGGSLNTENCLGSDQRRSTDPCTTHLNVTVSVWRPRRLVQWPFDHTLPSSTPHQLTREASWALRRGGRIAAGFADFLFAIH